MISLIYSIKRSYALNSIDSHEVIANLDANYLATQTCGVGGCSGTGGSRGRSTRWWGEKGEVRISFSKLAPVEWNMIMNDLNVFNVFQRNI